MALRLRPQPATPAPLRDPLPHPGAARRARLPGDPLGRGRAAGPAAAPHVPADGGRARTGQVATRRDRPGPPAGGGGLGSVRAFERLLSATARRVLAWSGRHAEPSRRPWVDALGGELELVQGGPARLLWALGGLSIVCSTRRTTLTRIWRSLPGPLRIGVFGIALAVVGVVAIVWSNVIVPSHESDDEYTTWYLVGYLVLFAYFGASGFLAAWTGSSIR